MARRILFVRAVNVGGVALPMARLRLLLESLGGSSVRTYIASGNAIVDVSGDPAAFDRSVESALTATFGWTREVMSRTPRQLADALSAHPFEVLEPKHSYVCFLASTPAAGAADRAHELATGGDRWSVIGEDLHIRYSNGAGTPQMNTEAVMRRLAVRGTARNLTTVRRLIDLAG